MVALDDVGGDDAIDGFDEPSLLAIRSSGSTSDGVCATEFFSRPSVWNIWMTGVPTLRAAPVRDAGQP
jgi:hypothetical protein